MQEFNEKLNLLSAYDDLSFLTNTTGGLVQACFDWIKACQDAVIKQEAREALERVMTERGYEFGPLPGLPKRTRRPSWSDPRDGISFPETFA